MIISHIIGGLGNQLFQYAAGKALAVKHNTSLLLDTRAFEDYKLRNFDLSCFNTSFKTADPSEITGLLPSTNYRKALQYLLPKHKRTYHRERTFNFEPSLLNAGPDVYLKGYFQSENYFTHISDLLRVEFILKDEYVTRVKQHNAELNKPNSVAIHVRRGDYANKDVQQLIAPVDSNYYNKAISVIRQRVTDPAFFVFSDDISWVKENLDLPHAQYVSGELSKTHLEDFYLLSQCSNFIIPNSTFAWWAAWLSKGMGSTIIAPRKWFIDDRYNRNRTPGSWTCI